MKKVSQRKKNIISRRKAVFYLISSLPSFFLFPKSIQWTGVLSLPKPMDWSMCRSYLTKIMIMDDLINLESKMMKKKKMLSKKIYFNKKRDKITFSFIFKTVSDYQYWSNKSNWYLNKKYVNGNNYHTNIRLIL